MARYYYTNAIIWALLVIATLFSFEAVSFASLHQHALTIAMIFACLKAHLIAQYFMELRDAQTMGHTLQRPVYCRDFGHCRH